MNARKAGLAFAVLALLGVIATLLIGCTSAPAPPPPTRVTQTWAKIPKAAAATPEPTTSNALPVVSNDGFEYLVGATITASASDDDPTAYQKNFNNQTLADIVEKSIKGFARNYLIPEFSQLTVQAACQQKAEIIQRVTARLSDLYGPQGITIENFGYVEIQQRSFSFSSTTPSTSKFLGFRNQALFAMSCGFGVENDKY